METITWKLIIETMLERDIVPATILIFWFVGVVMGMLLLKLSGGC